MELTLSITTAEDTWTVTTTPWTIMLWERKYHTKASRIPEVGLGLEDLVFLGWEATKMSGRTVPISFDTFAQQVTGIEVGAASDGARPTPPAP